MAPCSTESSSGNGIRRATDVCLDGSDELRQRRVQVEAVAASAMAHSYPLIAACKTSWRKNTSTALGHLFTTEPERAFVVVARDDQNCNSGWDSGLNLPVMVPTNGNCDVDDV